MNNLQQEIIVFVILSISVGYLIFKIVKRFNNKKPKDADCSDCSDCPIKKECDKVKK